MSENAKHTHAPDKCFCERSQHEVSKSGSKIFDEPCVPKRAIRRRRDTVKQCTGK